MEGKKDTKILLCHFPKRLPETTQENPTKTSTQLFTCHVYFSRDSRASKARLEHGRREKKPTGGLGCMRPAMASRPWGLFCGVEGWRPDSLTSAEDRGAWGPGEREP